MAFPPFQDLLHTHDKFIGPIPEDFEAGTRALHSLLPRLFDSKVAMTTATAAGFRFPQTALGDAFRWLRQEFGAKKETEETTAMEPKATATEETAIATDSSEQTTTLTATDAAVAVPAHDSATEKANRGVNGGSLPVRVDDHKAAAGDDIEKEAAALENTRQAWDALFAPGFEERYAEGGHEHEAGYDAYLTGCCFAAAATLGLGVGVDELRRMGLGGETPAALAPVLNVVPLFRMVSEGIWYFLFAGGDVYSIRGAALCLVVLRLLRCLREMNAYVVAKTVQLPRRQEVSTC